MTMKLNIAKEFYPSPIGRHRTDGKRSSEAFREDVLRPKINQAIAKGEVLEIDVSDMTGLNSSFFEESFGGLVCVGKLSAEQILKVLRFPPGDAYMAYYLKHLKKCIEEEEKRQLER